jgi:hypothetical protein
LTFLSVRREWPDGLKKKTPARFATGVFHRGRDLESLPRRVSSFRGAIT